MKGDDKFKYLEEEDMDNFQPLSEGNIVDKFDDEEEYEEDFDENEEDVLSDEEPLEEENASEEEKE